MLLPYGTDAPVYYFPYATVGIIGLNAAMFLATGMGDYIDCRWLILEYDRINPLQWLTAAFMHASWIHLIGNMIFLWCLGLVVEGKLGYARFSLLYVALALADGAIGQIPMFLFSDGQGGALGASGVIFALIAVAVVWSPENDIHFLFFWWWFLYWTIEIPIYGVALFYVAIELLQLWLVGFQMSTPLLHLLGLAVGFPFAIYMLKYRLVDCEGWDLFTRAGMPLQQKDPSQALDAVAWVFRSVPAQDRAEDRASELTLVDSTRDPFAAAVESFSLAVGANQLEQAITDFQQLRQQCRIPALPDAMLVAYINLLSKRAKHSESLYPLRQLVARQTKYANESCLRIATIEIKYNDDPEAALLALKQMSLPLDDRKLRQRNRIQRIVRAKMETARSGETKVPSSV
jgi:membrane associated rhomboid family serine protease